MRIIDILPLIVGVVLIFEILYIIIKEMIIDANLKDKRLK